MQQLKNIQLKTATIIWHEGTGEFDGQTFTTWAAFQKAFDKIYKQHGNGEGYTKVKISLLWEDGTGITDRVDVADSLGNYSPKHGTIGQYIQKYCRVNHLPLAFEDHSKKAANRPKISHNLTFDELCALQLNPLLN